mmetsp:Transcript_22288/g.39250  ORF Transcript_22288/g.39250 Transcript_22288/m.39250 type:complete len:511 (-) Transcript_22288:28-1560(-)
MLRAPHVVSLAAALSCSWLQLVAGTAEGLKELSWWIPVSGIAKDSTWVEDVDFAPETVAVPRRHRHPGNAEQHLLSNEPWLRHNPARGTVLILLGESESEMRLHGSVKTDGLGVTSAIGSGAVNTAGLGSGSNAGSGQAVDQQATSQQGGGQQAGSNTAASQATASGVRGAQKQVPRRTWVSIFRYSLSFALILKALCISSNVCVQATPMGTVRAFSAKGDTGDLDMAPFISCAYGGWQWCFYGLFAYLVTHKSGFLVLVYSNCVGATLGLYYVFAFNRNCKNRGMLDRTTTYYYPVLGTIITVQVGAICTLQPVRALFFCGLISSSWSIIGSLSLLTTVPEVWRTRNSSSLQLPLLICGEVSAMLWFACGVMLWDPWITFPSMFSGAACTYAHSLCIRFPARDLDHNAPGASDSHDAADISSQTSPATLCNSPVSLVASPSFIARSPPPTTASPWALTRALNLVRGQSSSSSPLLGSREEPASSADSKFEGGNYGAVPGTGGTGESPLC